MAAISYAAPGTKWGPCKDACEHTDCAEARRLVAWVCRFCGNPIGYDTRCYADPEGTDKYAQVHASCYEDLIETERKNTSAQRKSET